MVSKPNSLSVPQENDLPLAGRRIVITRARAQAAPLVQHLERLGAEVIEFPTIEIRAAESFAALDEAIARLANYDWLIFTSVNGIEPFLSRLAHAGLDLSAAAHLRIGAIGPETAKRLEASGFRATLVPERYQAEGILDALSPQEIAGKRFLIPRAARARDILPETLRRWGALVDVVPAYRTVLPQTDIRPLSVMLSRGKVAVIAFTSSSTVKNFLRLFGAARLSEITGESAIACIGPITADTVVEMGGEAHIVAQEFTVSGLAAAIVEYFSGRAK